MSAESAPAGVSSLPLPEEDPFVQIMAGQELSKEFVEGTSATEVPFGFFTLGEIVEDRRRNAMASATGYSGNNGEESC